VNFAHYDPARVSKLYALEPNPEMVRLAESRRQGTRLDIEFLRRPGERIRCWGVAVAGTQVP
jgi:hypothetical protein